MGTLGRLRDATSRSACAAASSPSSRTTSATSARAWPKRTGHPSTGTRKICPTTLSATTPCPRRCCGGGTSLCPFPASGRRAPKHSTHANPDGRSRITDLWLGERRIPRDRWASYRTLVDQLWAGDPPEIAEQATRMAADGLDRDVIFDKLIKDTSIRA